MDMRETSHALWQLLLSVHMKKTLPLRVMVCTLSIEIFQGREKNENWHKDVSKDGEVKLIGSHAKIYVETIPLFLLPMVCL